MELPDNLPEDETVDIISETAVLDFYAQAIKTRRERLSEFALLTDEEKTERINYHLGLMGQ